MVKRDMEILMISVAAGVAFGIGVIPFQRGIIPFQ
jgi:hypothetical protein